MVVDDRDRLDPLEDRRELGVAEVVDVDDDQERIALDRFERLLLVKIIDLYWPFCERLVTLTIPGTVKEIRDAWITEADNLKSIVIEEGVEKLMHYCFYNNPALEEITLPDSLKVMQEDCFSGCPKLKTVHCSLKIWNKYKKMFPGATRKDKENMNKVNEMDEYEVVDDNPLKSEYLSKQWMSVHRVKRTAEHLLEIISNLDNAQRGRGWTPEIQKEYKQCRDEFLVEMDEAADALK